MPSRALLDAIRKGDFVAVKNVLATDTTALSSREEPASAVLTALYHSQHEIADFLATRADLDVFEASAAGKTARLAEIVAADSSAAAQQAADGWTPLHLAAFFGRTEAARQLMDAGADLKALSSNTTANTPLHAALAGRGDEEMILRMLTAGADASAASGEGYTALHIAATRGDQRICDLLLQYNAQPSAKSRDGKTAADLAAERGHDALSDYLRAQE